jgi:hypothetical protein
LLFYSFPFLSGFILVFVRLFSLATVLPVIGHWAEELARKQTNFWTELWFFISVIILQNCVYVALTVCWVVFNVLWHTPFLEAYNCRSEAGIARHGVERPCCPSSSVLPGRSTVAQHGPCCVSLLHIRWNQLTRMPINNAVEWIFFNCLQNTSETFILQIANQPENTVGTSRWLHNTCVSSLFTFAQSIIILTLGYSCKNGSVLRTNLTLSRTHKLAPPAALYTKFTVLWNEMP